MTPTERIFVALDTPDLAHALALAGQLSGLVGGVKLGKEFFTALGPEGVRHVAAAGHRIFLDLKFHDIPATVAGAVRAAVALDPFMLNVHAAGGEAMMRAAVDAAGESAEETHHPRPLVLAVTVLTSLWSGDLTATGVEGTISEQVLRLASLAQNCGLDGVVCSPREVDVLRDALGTDFKLVVPGIRSEGEQSDDQKRVMTPAEAIELGADYLVIGRPITGAADPADAAKRIVDEIAQ